LPDFDNVPDSCQQFLEPTAEKGSFKILDWEKWLSRKPAQIGKTVIVAGQNQVYNSKVIGIHEAQRSTNVLLVEPLFPEPPSEIFLRKPEVIVKLAFVEGGYAVTTSFPAQVLREIRSKDVSGVALDVLFPPKVTFSPYNITPKRNQTFSLRMALGGKWYSEQVLSMSLSEIRFKKSFSQKVSTEGYMVQRASLNLEKDIPTIALKVIMVPDRGKECTATIDGMSKEAKQHLVSFIDRTWYEKNETVVRRQKEARVRAASDASGEYIKTMQKDHFILLSDDKDWEYKLNEYGVTRMIQDVDTDYVIGELLSNRNDLIVADADLWQDESPDLGVALHFEKELRKTPLFWIAGKDNMYSGERSRELIGLNSYDLFDRNIDDAQLRKSFEWATKFDEMGEGIPIVIISPIDRHIYRLGIALSREGYKIIKVKTMQNPLARLNKYQPVGIIVDSVGIGKGFDMILKPCLSWSKRGARKSKVFLLTQFLDQADVVRWIADGLSDILIYGHSMDEIAQRVFNTLSK